MKTTCLSVWLSVCQSVCLLFLSPSLINTILTLGQPPKKYTPARTCWSPVTVLRGPPLSTWTVEVRNIEGKGYLQKSLHHLITALKRPFSFYCFKSDWYQNVPSPPPHSSNGFNKGLYCLESFVDSSLRY